MCELIYHEWEWNQTPYLKFSFHILVQDEVTETHEMEISNIWGKVVFSLWISRSASKLQLYSIVHTPLISLGQGTLETWMGQFPQPSPWSIVLVLGVLDANFPVGLGRDSRNTDVSDSNNFSGGKIGRTRKPLESIKSICWATLLSSLKHFFFTLFINVSEVALP